MNKQILKLLQRLECSKYDYDNNYHRCPDCSENFYKYGHLISCELANTIKNLGGEVEFQRE